MSAAEKLIQKRMATDRIARLDEWIRSGQLARVREELSRVRPADVPRAELAPLANMARRAGVPALALRLLHPVVRPAYPLAQEAGPSELAIYASALARIGALEEAGAIFHSLRDNNTAEVLLFSAFAQIYQWNYPDAVAPLKRYLRLPGLSEYERVIGRMNLAACFQFMDTHHDEKAKLLDSILASSRANSWDRMRKNACELSAQAALDRRDWAAVEDFLRQAETLSSADDLLIEKWRAVAAFRRDPDVPEAAERLFALRRRAEAARDWETVRDCDFYRASLWRESDLMAHVYFGTAHRPFRRRVLRASGEWFTIPSRYVWRSAATAGGDGEARVFDLVTGRFQEGPVGLRPGLKLMRLFRFLASDFYRSFQLGSAFAHLYPGEYFDVDSSPARVRRTVDRLRGWLAESGLNINIICDEGRFRLSHSGPCALRVPPEIALAGDRLLLGDQLSRLKEAWPYRAFSSGQAAECLGTSADHVRELLKSALAQKKVHAEGRGRARRYFFSK